MKKASAVVVASLLVLAGSIVAVAQKEEQTRDKFVISARAGGVNSVAGKASVRGRGRTEWEQLTIKEDLDTGDVVKTGGDGRVEMLLNPGSYLRIGENSEFELTDSSLDSLEVRLIRGTAIVEATGTDDTALLINIRTPHTKLAIVRRGLYRLNVVPGDNTELIVRKGRVMLDRTHQKIQSGNKVVFNNDSFFVAKLSKEEKKKVDGLDAWSKDRAETVAKANRKIREREMRTAMLLAGNNYWSFFDVRHSGLWYYSAAFGCYTFVPFMLGWGSPYGGSYSYSFYNHCCRYPLWARPENAQGNYGSRVTGSSSGGSAGSGTGYGSGSGSGSGSSSGNPSPMPTAPAPAPMREIPAAAERHIDRHNDRMPNP